MPKPPTAEDFRQYAERQASLEATIAGNKASAATLTDEITALEAALSAPVKNGTDANELRLTKIRLADAEFARYSVLEANDALAPEYAEVLAGPPDTDDAA